LAEGLIRILETAEGFELRGHCQAVADLERQLGEYKPDLLLLDLTSDVHFGLLAGMQAAVGQTKVVLWVRGISTELALQAMGVGVRGVLRKTLPAETLVRCLNRVHDGELWFEKALTDTLMSTRRYTLTRREGQLVTLLSQGLKNKEIATAMEISEGSVKVYLSRLFQKLGVKDRFELALFGLKNLTHGPDSVNAKDRTGTQLPMTQAPRSFFVERIPAQTARTENRVAAWR